MGDIARNTLLHGDTAAILLLTLIGLVTLLVLGWLVLFVRLNRISQRLVALTRGVESQSLEETLTTHMETVDRTTCRMDALEQSVGVLQAQLPSCLQRVNLVRYDAFDDVGGEQSFSLALVDAQGDGVVITSVYSRLDVRVYCKAIRNGRASHALSGEEERALRETAR